jgi:hypothetical protein
MKSNVLRHPPAQDMVKGRGWRRSAAADASCRRPLRSQNGHGQDVVTEMLPVLVGRPDASGRHPRFTVAPADGTSQSGIHNS